MELCPNPSLLMVPITIRIGRPTSIILLSGQPEGSFFFIITWIINCFMATGPFPMKYVKTSYCPFFKFLETFEEFNARIWALRFVGHRVMSNRHSPGGRHRPETRLRTVEKNIRL